jgi:hypothetical protein
MIFINEIIKEMRCVENALLVDLAAMQLCGESTPDCSLGNLWQLTEWGVCGCLECCCAVSCLG